MISIKPNSYKSFVFSGGEVHVELTEQTKQVIKIVSVMEDTKDVIIEVPITSPTRMMEVILLNDILKAEGYKVSLSIPYIPYARQDRRTIDFGVNSLKVFANIINACNFEKVVAVDPHSIVCENVIDRLEIYEHIQCIDKFISNTLADNKRTYLDVTLLAPDLGALKKVQKYAKQLKEIYNLSNDIPVIAVNKVRNPATGNIESIEIIGNTNAALSSDIFVIDDICDGGATFIELLEKSTLKKHAKSVNLFVTHGIFANEAVKRLKKAGYDRIGTTTSIPHDNIEIADNGYIKQNVEIFEI